jgi:threonine dehydrogenase-like Zn-dependent dehydrogenase
MRALTVTGRSLHVRELPDPQPGPGELLVAAVALGICGTDREIVEAGRGTPPPGRDFLILGHESLGRVVVVAEASATPSGRTGLTTAADPSGSTEAGPSGSATGRTSGSTAAGPSGSATARTSGSTAAGPSGSATASDVSHTAQMPAVGDLVVGVVRRPDPEPCGACARGQFDMCRNGRYTERGIKALDGYGSTLWTVEADYAVVLPAALAGDNVGVLLEPASVVAKAWEQVERIGGRAWFEPETVLVTGAGPIGQLAALLGVQRGLDVHVLDRVEGGTKARLVRELGATYHHAPADEVLSRLRPDVVIEATGAGDLVFAALAGTAAYGIICLTGVSSGGRALTFDAGSVNRDMVLENDAVVGSVNANLSHYALAVDALQRADHAWLASLITNRIPLDEAATNGFVTNNGVKTIVTF